jgi:hypothetical protein
MNVYILNSPLGYNLELSDRLQQHYNTLVELIQGEHENVMGTSKCDIDFKHVADWSNILKRAAEPRSKYVFRKPGDSESDTKDISEGDLISEGDVNLAMNTDETNSSGSSDSSTPPRSELPVHLLNNVSASSDSQALNANSNSPMNANGVQNGTVENKREGQPAEKKTSLIVVSEDKQQPAERKQSLQQSPSGKVGLQPSNTQILGVSSNLKPLENPSATTKPLVDSKRASMSPNGNSNLNGLDLISKGVTLLKKEQPASPHDLVQQLESVVKKLESEKKRTTVVSTSMDEIKFANPLKHGYLEKRGYWNTAYKVRYCRIETSTSGPILKYFRSPADSDAQGSVSLRTARVMLGKADKKGDQHSSKTFTVEPKPRGRVFHFRTALSEEAQDWVRALNAIVDEFLNGNNAAQADMPRRRG